MKQEADDLDAHWQQVGLQRKEKQERHIQKQLNAISKAKNQKMDGTDEFMDTVSQNTMLSKKTNSVYKAPVYAQPAYYQPQPAYYQPVPQYAPTGQQPSKSGGSQYSSGRKS